MTDQQKVLSTEDNRVQAAPTGGNPSARKAIPEDAMIVIPMRNTVLFPGVITPITVGRAMSVAAAQEAVRT